MGIQEMLKNDDAFPVCDLGTVFSTVFSTVTAPIIACCAIIPAMLFPMLMGGKV